MRRTVAVPVRRHAGLCGPVRGLSRLDVPRCISTVPILSQIRVESGFERGGMGTRAVHASRLAGTNTGRAGEVRRRLDGDWEQVNDQTRYWRQAVELPKDKIIELLRSRGENDKADRANDELPDQVDTDKHGDQLDKLGIDPGSLLGGIGNKLGL
jgi:hypothetical protein